MRREELFHGLSPTRYADLAVGSCLAHLEYEHCSFKIRKTDARSLTEQTPTDRPRGGTPGANVVRRGRDNGANQADKAPSALPTEHLSHEVKRLVVKTIGTAISNYCDREELLWCAWLRDTKAGYLGEQDGAWTTPIYIGDAMPDRREFRQRLASYVDGITAESQNRRAFTLTLFARRTEQRNMAELRSQLEQAIREGVRSTLGEAGEVVAADELELTASLELVPTTLHGFIPVQG